MYTPPQDYFGFCNSKFYLVLRTGNFFVNVKLLIYHIKFFETRSLQTPLPSVIIVITLLFGSAPLKPLTIFYERGLPLSIFNNINHTTLSTVPKKLQSKSLTVLAVDAETQQATKLQSLITLAQSGDKDALTELCTGFEPLFRKEMRREIFYKALGFDEGLSLARLKFIELVLTYNGADYEHFPGYVRCRIHFALYDEVKKVWADENKKTPLPQNDEAEGAEFADNIIERKELSILLRFALAKLNDKQRQTITALYFNGLSGKETAKLLNCSPAMIVKHHRQALKILKDKIV